MKKQRDSNLELLRIVAIVLIIMMHVFAVTSKASYVSPLNVSIGHWVNAIGNCGVSCFLLISGYYGIRFHIDKFSHIIVLSKFYSVLLVLVAIWCATDNVMPAVTTNFLYSLFHDNWFVSCYVVLMLLSKYLNLLCEKLSRKDFTILVILGAVCFSVFPTIYVNYDNSIVCNGGKCLVYCIFVYLFGAISATLWQEPIQPEMAVACVCRVNGFHSRD